MKEEIEQIIMKLERVQDLLYRGSYSEASTKVYEAQGDMQLLKDRAIKD